MNRRRMMLQQASGYAITYNADSGIYPDDNGEWEFIGGTFYPNNADNYRRLENGLLICGVKHLYSLQQYIPKGHTMAKRSEITVTVKSWVHNNTWGTGYNGNIIGIRLADENTVLNIKLDKLGIGARSVNGADVTASSQQLNNIGKYPCELPQEFTVRVVKYEDFGEVYLDDELILTALTLNDNASAVTNWVSVGGIMTTAISSMTYKEW